MRNTLVLLGFIGAVVLSQAAWGAGSVQVCDPVNLGYCANVDSTGHVLTTNGTGSSASQVQGNAASGAADTGNPVKTGGVYNSSPVTVTNGQRVDAQADSHGSTKQLQVDSTGAAIDYTQNLSINPYPGGSTPITGPSTGTTGAVTGTLSGTSGKTTYICSFDVSGTGGTAQIGPITVAGLKGGSAVYNVSANVANTATYLARTYTPCVPASATNTAITVTTTADGTATAVSVNTFGYQL